MSALVRETTGLVVAWALIALLALGLAIEAAVLWLAGLIQGPRRRRRALRQLETAWLEQARRGMS